MITFLKEGRPNSEQDRENLLELFGGRVTRYGSVRRDAEVEHKRAMEALKTLKEQGGESGRSEKLDLDTITPVPAVVSRALSDADNDETE